MAVLVLFAGFLNADNIININDILKQNEALVIDAKNNEINFVLEITKDGKIKKRQLSEYEKTAIYKILDSTTMLDSTQKVDKYPHSHIKEWDKKKIIYEQIVDKIEILR